MTRLARTLLILSITLSLGVASGVFGLGRSGAPATVQAQGGSVVSCLGVLHRNSMAPDICDTLDTQGAYVASAGIDGSTYKVEYRLATCGYPTTWSSWSTAWDEDPVYWYDNWTIGVHTWRYVSAPVPAGVYCICQWRVTTVDHSGTRCCDEASLTSTSYAEANSGYFQSQACTGLPLTTIVVNY